MQWSKVWVSDLGWAVSGLLILFLTRLPQLVSPHFLLDGDEAIVGLMAKHLLEGNAVPGWFYGQQYGFALVEVVAGALAYKLLGFSDVSLRLAMLVIFWLGWWGFFRASVRLVNRPMAIFLSLLLLVVPAWGLWAMKARGGYLTAFAASQWALWALLAERRKSAHWLVVGASLALVYLSQRLWLLPVVPFLALALFRDRKRGAPLWMAPAALAVYFGLPFLADEPGAEFWQPDLLGLEALEQLDEKALFGWAEGKMLWSGHYYLNQPMEMNFVTALNGHLWMVVSVSIGLFFLYSAVRRKLNAREFMIGLSVFSGLALYAILLFAHISPRYFLPFVSFVIMAGGMIILKVSGSDKVISWQRSAGSLFIALNLMSLVSFYDYAFMWPRRLDTQVSERTELLQAVHWCRRLQVHGVFASEPLGQWQFSFYSHERPVARWKLMEDRIPAYGLRVTEAWALNEATAVLVEERARWMLDGVPSGQLVRVGERYTLYLRPSREWLESHGYEL